MNREPVILASRWIRLLAAIIDGLIMGALIIPLVYILPAFGLDPRNPENSFASNFLLSALGAGIFLCVNGHLLRKYGQTVGKKIVGIRIVSTTGEDLTLWRLFFLRYMIISVVSGIARFGWAIAWIDPMMIFMKDRRCLHDHFAGTIVVNNASNKWLEATPSSSASLE